MSKVSSSGPTPVFGGKFDKYGDLPLVAINTSSQLPFKLTPFNYPSWRAQFFTLLIGYDLLGYIDGTFPCPPKTASSSTTAFSLSPAYLHWFRQDKLLLNVIFASVSESVMPLIAVASTS